MTLEDVVTTSAHLSELRRIGVKSATFASGRVTAVEFFDRDEPAPEETETGFRRRSNKLKDQKNAAKQAEKTEARQREVLFASTGMVPQVAKSDKE